MTLVGSSSTQLRQRRLHQQEEPHDVPPPPPPPPPQRPAAPLPSFSSTSSSRSSGSGSDTSTTRNSRASKKKKKESWEDVDVDDDDDNDNREERGSITGWGGEEEEEASIARTTTARATDSSTSSADASNPTRSSRSGGGIAATSSLALGRSLLLGAITFAAVLVAASSHESFFVDRFLFLGAGGGGGGENGRKPGEGGGAQATSAAAYIAPPPVGKQQQQATFSTAGTKDGSSSAAALLVVPPATAAKRRTQGSTKRRNPFGRLIQKFVTRKPPRAGVSSDDPQATATAATATKRQPQRRWFGSSWDKNKAIESSVKTTAISPVPSDSTPATVPTFTQSMATELQRRFPTAYTEISPALTSIDLVYLHEYALVVHRHYDKDAETSHGSSSSSMAATLGTHWHNEATSPTVAWGGGGLGDCRDSPHLAWWDDGTTRVKRGGRGGSEKGSATDLDRIDGGHVLYSYYRIMKAVYDHNKKRHKSEAFDLSNVYFPLKKCHPPDGCSAAEAIDHTLQWRASYQPWKVNANVLRENAVGWMYARGWGTAPDSAPSSPTSYGRHAILWARPGIHRAHDGDAWIRTVLHGADLAVAQALHESGGKVGKFNAVIDVTGFEWGRTLPAISTIQRAVAALQDHFPNRLGVVALLNLSRGAEIVVNLIKPWLTKDVRDKIHVLSAHDLPLLVERGSIPSWLGGPDEYEFDVNQYYPARVRF